MPGGKPAGVPCTQLDASGRCRLFGRPERPPVCLGLAPSPTMCGAGAGEALRILAWLEQATRPGA